MSAIDQQQQYQQQQGQEGEVQDSNAPRMKPMGSNHSLNQEFDGARPSTADAASAQDAAAAASAQQKQKLLAQHHKVQLQKLAQKNDEEVQLAEMARDYLKKRGDLNAQWATQVDKLNKQFLQKSSALAAASVVQADNKAANRLSIGGSSSPSPVANASAVEALPSVDEAGAPIAAAPKKNSKAVNVEPILQSHKAFHALLQESEKVVKARQTADEKVAKEVTDKIKDLNQKKQARSKKLQENLQKLQIELVKEHAEFERVKKAYEDAQTYNASQRSKLQAEEGEGKGKGLKSLFSSKDDRIKKYQKKVQETTVKLNQTRDDYLLQLDVLNAAHSQYYNSTLPQYIKTADGEYFAQLKSFLQISADGENAFGAQLSEGGASVNGQASKIDRDAEYQTFYQSNRATQVAQPQVFHFQAHGDDTSAVFVIASDEQKQALITKMTALQTQQLEAQMQIEINESSGAEQAIELNRYNLDLNKANAQIKRLQNAGVPLQNVPKPQRPAKVAKNVENPIAASEESPAAASPQAETVDSPTETGDVQLPDGPPVPVSNKPQTSEPEAEVEAPSSPVDEQPNQSNKTSLADIDQNFSSQKVEMVPESFNQESPLLENRPMDYPTTEQSYAPVAPAEEQSYAPPAPVEEQSFAPPPPAEEEKPAATGSQSTLNQIANAAAAAPPAPVASADTVVAMFNYMPQLPIELEFVEGDSIEITNRNIPDDVDLNWYEGRNIRTGMVGQFPRSYVA